ncbi:kazal-type serine protease inhibitor domain-containing protein 1-like [Phyllobates terribilis]|uniref:kazal-type serine protease inhibitor domain-containing protein 1-like n=1 Tax=Phyllobates terribilis TaxID=111132 RepID=UPI003CCAB910
MYALQSLWLVSLLALQPSPALLRILPHRGWSNEVEVTKNCPLCQEFSCPSGPQRCPAGRVKDHCGCCWQCANVEGQLCDLPWQKRHYGPCGEELQCQVMAVHSDEPQCVCSNQETVCGSDRRTYRNICRLQEAARTRRKTVLSLAHTGPCQEAPVLLTSHQDTVAVIGQSLILGCEVSAQPIAEMEWRKEGVERALPGEHGHIIIQSRGGPLRHQVTGWLQIHQVKQRDAGVYTCRAWNVYGEVSSSAQLTVISQEHIANIKKKLSSTSWTAKHLLDNMKEPSGIMDNQIPTGVQWNMDN